MKSPKDFQRAFQSGNRARGEVLVVAVVDNGGQHTRLGLSIGKSVWRGAVQRNRVRRIFREAFRLSRPELPVGVDVVMMAAAPRLEPTLEATRRELVHLVRKAHRRYLEKMARTPGPAETGEQQAENAS
jgi:ribonuclease P protein component